MGAVAAAAPAFCCCCGKGSGRGGGGGAEGFSGGCGVHSYPCRGVGCDRRRHQCGQAVYWPVGQLTCAPSPPPLTSLRQCRPQVKITDFGLSKFFDEQSTVMKTPCGTPGYIAPEVLHMKGYDKQCDVWSLGVIVYILLCGFPPFYADNDAQLFERIKKGKYEFLKPYWDPVSDGAKSFIRRMLVVDPKERATCAQLMEDPWLSDAAAKIKAAEATPESSSSAKLSTSAEITPSQQNLRKLKGAFLAAWVATSHTGDETER